MNRIILLSFLWLICFTNNAIHAENSFKTYFGKVYSIGDTITIGRNNGYIYEFDNSQTRTIKQDLSGKKLTISQFYNIKKLNTLQRMLLPFDMNSNGVIIAKGNGKSYLIDLDNAIFNGSIMLSYKKSYFDGATDLTSDILFAYRIKIYNIKITDNIVEQYLKLCITPKEYGRIQSDPFIMSDIRKKYRAKLNEAISQIDFNKVFRLKCITNVKQYDMDKNAFPIWKMEFTDRDFNKNRQLNDIGYCTFGEAAFTFKNSKEFTNLYCPPEKAKFLYSLARYKSYTLNDKTDLVSYVYIRIQNKRIDTYQIPGYKKPIDRSDDKLKDFCIDMNIIKVDGYYVKLNRKDKEEISDFYVGSITSNTILH